MSTKKPNRILSFNRQSRVRLLSLLSGMFLFQANSYAVLNTHDWQESHRGYSIEIIPGTSGTTAEYVAAGTIWDASSRIASWHFMHLDANGSVLDSRISTAVVTTEIRVVDIAVQNSNAFRITMQCKDFNTGGINDFVYIHGVDINGNDLATNPSIKVNSSDLTYTNLYPTHSYYADNALFICGYSTKEVLPLHDQNPNNYYTDKVSYMMRINVNAPPVTHSEYFWNTGNAGDPRDFDMPLRIAPYSYANEFPLLVTGALNDNGGNCGVLVMKFNNTAMVTTFNGIQYPFALSAPTEFKGAYGVDIRGDIEGLGDAGDIIVLVNTINSEDDLEKRWGIMRIQNNLASYGLGTLSFMLNNKTYAWANQFLELHYTNYNFPGYPQGNLGDHIYVVGQQIDKCAQSLPSGSLTPSTTNINPFTTFAKVAGPGIWSLSTPVGYSVATIFGNTRTYLSSEGTSAPNMDYFNGSLTAGSALEDVSRLYTFSSHDRYYDGVPNTTPSNPAIIAPIGGTSGSNNELLTKFLGLTYTGTVYSETNCQKEVDDCNNATRLETYDDASFVSWLHNGVDIDQPMSFNDDFYTPSEIDCSTGYYKTTGIKYLNSNQDFKFYPNPANKEINVGLPQQITSSDKVEFILTDITGKTVYNNNSNASSGSAIKYQLPNLAAGTYIGTINLNGTKYSNKVIIK